MKSKMKYNSLGKKKASVFDNPGGSTVVKESQLNTLKKIRTFTSSCKVKSAKNHKNLNSSSARSYESVVLQKKQILKENKQRCGIYL